MEPAASLRLSSRWRILIAGVVAQGSFSALHLGLPALGPVFQSRFSLEVAQVGMLLTSVSVGLVLTNLAWGALADMIGERKVLVIALIKIFACHCWLFRGVCCVALRQRWCGFQPSISE